MSWGKYFTFTESTLNNRDQKYFTFTESTLNNRDQKYFTFTESTLNNRSVVPGTIARGKTGKLFRCLSATGSLIKVGTVSFPFRTRYDGSSNLVSEWRHSIKNEGFFLQVQRRRFLPLQEALRAETLASFNPCTLYFFSDSSNFLCPPNVRANAERHCAVA